MLARSLCVPRKDPISGNEAANKGMNRTETRRKKVTASQPLYEAVLCRDDTTACPNFRGTIQLPLPEPGTSISREPGRKRENDEHCRAAFSIFPPSPDKKSRILTSKGGGSHLFACRVPAQSKMRSPPSPPPPPTVFRQAAELKEMGQRGRKEGRSREGGSIPRTTPSV